MSTQPANTFDTFDSPTNREDLHDVITMITPSETPLFSMLPERKTEAHKHEWPIDSLASPDLDNAEVQGYTYNFDPTDSPDRVGNYHQIFSKEFLIAETQEAVKKAGRTSDVSYTKVKKGKEIRIDMEVAFLSNNASVAGSASVPAKSGGLRAWLSTNDNMGSGGSSGGYNSSTGVVDAATNGTQRAFTKDILDNVIQGTYDNGGNPDALMVSPYVKRIFSTFMSDTDVAQQRYTASANKQSTIVGAADAYLSDFGLIDVVPNRQMSRAGATIARNAFLIDRSKASKGFLRRIKEDKNVAKTSDGIPVVMNGEVTLIVGNEAAHGVAADLYGMTASS